MKASSLLAVGSVVLLTLATGAQASGGPAPDAPAPSVWVSEQADSGPTTTIQGCSVYVHADHVPAASGQVSVVWRSQGPGNPEFANATWTGTPEADGHGFSVLFGPVAIPNAQEQQKAPMMAFAVLEWNAGPGSDVQVEFSPDFTPLCQTTASVPFFPSPLALGFAVAGSAGVAGVALFARRK